jgi:hypothetical protein
MVADMNGRMVKQLNVLLQQGTNNVALSGFDQFQKGQYIVSISTREQRSAAQVIVQ